MTLQGIGKSESSRKLLILVAAFAAVYIIWGSTYLAIKYAIETIPTFIMAGVRFLTAGAVLYAAARMSKGYKRPTAIHWRTAFIVGTLLLGFGNGFVVLAEHYISSSMAALLVASNPFWVVVLGWLFMKRGRPNYKVALGLVVGFFGVAMLVLGGNGDGAGQGSQLTGIVLIIIATVGWAFGSLYGAVAPTSDSNVLASGMQMLAGGFVLLMVSVISGEWNTFDIGSVSAVSLGALVYLTFVGALVAYTAYSWLLQNASPSLVSTYAYVNPVVAVLLGWAIAGEAVTGPMLAGAAVIIASIALISSNNKKPATEAEERIPLSRTQASEPVSSSV